MADDQVVTYRTYKIPDSLDKTFLDVEIAIRNNDGLGIKPLPVKVILAALVSIVLLFWLASQTFIATGGPLTIVLFCIGWIAMTVLLLIPDKTGTMQFEKLPVLFNYLPKANRYVSTKTSGRASDFMSICGIKDIDPENGLISFVDGSYGFALSVVGSGSALLFETDRELILNRVDTFYRNMRTNYEFIYITRRAAQNVTKPLAAMDKRLEELKNDDRELYALALMERDYLADRVGKRFRSVHQYLIIKAPNLELLEDGQMFVDTEARSSLRMFKQCRALFGDELYDLFGSIYKGKESV